jgi:tRNA (guanine-N7-)-methyltransferase
VDGRFLQLLATRLLPGGRLTIATDHAEYAAAIAQCLETSPHFMSLLPTLFANQDAERLRTKYEQIALSAGRTCYYFKWQRNDAPSPPGFAIPQEVPMPHVILRSPLRPAEIAGRFVPQQLAEGSVHVRLPMLFQAQAGELLLVEAYVHEEPLSQRVGVLIRPREAGHYLVGLAEIGFPRPTPGLQLAIAGLARWLLSLHEDTAVIHHNLPI